MTDTIPEAATGGGLGEGLTDAEKLAALETYLKVLKAAAERLRAAVTADMGARRVERVGAYLPDGTKMAAVGYSGGRVTARIADEGAALAWCLRNHPDEVVTVQAIRPAYLKLLLDRAKSEGYGLDATTGEVLPFIEVGKGDPYITVTTTEMGRDRMAALAGGFTAMLEAGV